MFLGFDIDPGSISIIGLGCGASFGINFDLATSAATGGAAFFAPCKNSNSLSFVVHVRDLYLKRNLKEEGGTSWFCGRFYISDVTVLALANAPCKT